MRINKEPSSTSKTIFDTTGIKNVSKSKRCRVLQGLERHVKPDIRPPLKVIHKEKRLNLALEYMKLDFKVVLFTYECRATLDGPDWCSKGWVAISSNRPIRV